MHIQVQLKLASFTNLSYGKLLNSLEGTRFGKFTGLFLKYSVGGDCGLWVSQTLELGFNNVNINYYYFLSHRKKV